MEQATKSRMLLGSGIVILLAFAWLAYLMFAMRDGPLGAGTWALAVVLLLVGVAFIWYSRRR